MPTDEPAPTSLVDTVTRLLGKTAGLPDETITEAQARLGFELPPPLVDLYTCAGGSPTIMAGFELVASPEDLVVDDRLVFCEENQGVCRWGVPVGPADPPVFQQNDTGWFPEDVPLSEFLRVLMYLNCANGGYQWCGMTYLDETDPGADLDELVSSWEPAVDHNGFVAFWRPDSLLWWMHDDGLPRYVFCACRTKKSKKTAKELGFVKL